jgi:hypothetical protein
MLLKSNIVHFQQNIPDFFFIFNHTDPYCDMSPGSQNTGAEKAAIARQRLRIRMQQ